MSNTTTNHAGGKGSEQQLAEGRQLPKQSNYAKRQGFSTGKLAVLVLPGAQESDNIVVGLGGGGEF